MNNPWLASAATKKMLEDIDRIALDVWSQDGTLSDLFAALNDDQTDLLFSMKIKEVFVDHTDMSCSVQLVQP